MNDLFGRLERLERYCLELTEQLEQERRWRRRLMKALIRRVDERTGEFYEHTHADDERFKTVEHRLNAIEVSLDRAKL